MCVVFVFKQKTAYEMRISDWSSDVCSSDLTGNVAGRIDIRSRGAHPVVHDHTAVVGLGDARFDKAEAIGIRRPSGGYEHLLGGDHLLCAVGGDTQLDAGSRARDSRSEEHTSELQSLIRTSYAVFCLKKKQQHKT